MHGSRPHPALAQPPAALAQEFPVLSFDALLLPALEEPQSGLPLAIAAYFFCWRLHLVAGPQAAGRLAEKPADVNCFAPLPAEGRQFAEHLRAASATHG